MIRARCEVLSSRRAGAYHLVTLVAPEIAEHARPGQFIQVAVPAGRAQFLRRSFFVHQTSRRGGWAGTLDFVLDSRAAPGAEWLADLRAHQFLDVIGPLGRPFSFPRKPANCLLVTEGYGAAPLYFLAEELHSRDHRVDMVVGAPTQDHVFKPIEGKRLSRSIVIVTEDGSVGEVGQVMDVLPDMVAKCGTEVVYAAGPRDMLRRVAEYCRVSGVAAQVAVEERMACGIGMCWACTVPVIRRDGRGYDNVRSCVEGPAIAAARILWDRWGQDGDLTVTPPEGFPVVIGWPE